MADPFDPVEGLTIEVVDSVAGSRKTLTAVAVALDRARRDNVKTLFAMPTLELIREMAEVARRQSDIPVAEITSRRDEDEDKPRGGVVDALITHLINSLGLSGRLTFTTHEAFHRVGVEWPDAAAEWEIVIDEAPEIVLARAPFALHDNDWILKSFLKLGKCPLSALVRRRRATLQAKARTAGITLFTAADARRLLVFDKFIADGAEKSSPGEVEQAKRHRDALLEKKAQAARDQTNAEMPELDSLTRPYAQVLAKTKPAVERRVKIRRWDQVYESLAPVPVWLAQGAVLFTDVGSWGLMTAHVGYGPMRSRVTISGFRRPDGLCAFRRVTMLGALFEHTLVHAVWQQLGAKFVPSALIPLRERTTALGTRRLRLYWLTDQGWSKRLRDRSGGIGEIFKLIAKAGVINLAEPICIQVNKDDGSEDDPRAIHRYFANALVMPHSVKGQNRFQGFNQLIHCAALNSHTPDIRWLETVLGIDSREQRICRTGQEIYQTMMRLSLRNPLSQHDVRVVVMDRDIAEWLVQWFSPVEQVEVIEIDSSGVVKRKARAGRPASGKAISHAERQRRYRERLRDRDGNSAL
jgi:hypothetical protein